MREGLMASGMMIKSPLPTLYKTTRSEITALFGGAKLVLAQIADLGRELGACGHR
ncbi:MAG TPA: hypothetical protein VI136_01860 [Verrucomicrobiae bacterium]